MLANPEQVAGYLLGRGLVRGERIVDDDLVILDVSRRHCNFESVSERGPSYFLKQDIESPGAASASAGTANGDREWNLGTVRHEADLYRVFDEMWPAGHPGRRLPRFYGFDPTEGVLILEAVAGSRSLAEYHYELRRFPSGIATELGKALAAVHRAFADCGDGTGALRGIPENLPWIFSLSSPTRWLYLHSSNANLEFLRIAQASEVLESSFEALRGQWTTDTLIHGDLKWTNCLFVPGSGSRRDFRVTLVDWELASRGDPLWDVGSIFSEYLNLWLSSIPTSGEEPPDRFLDAARFPLRRMQPSIRAFWKAYVDAAGIPRRDVARRLGRAVGYSGLRLVQTAFEQLQDQPAVTNGAIGRLQLCLNILSRPEEAAVQLLGLPLSAVLKNG